MKIEIQELIDKAHARKHKNTNIDQWQPIETAPRDGAKILLGVFKNNKWYEVLGRFNLKGYNAGVFTTVPTGFRDSDWPTHWMPLPKPPVKESLTTDYAADKPHTLNT